MTLAAGLAIILFGLCGGLHARAMAFAMHLTDRKHITGTGALLIALYVLAAAHIAEAGLYAVGFFIGESTGIGGFAQSEALMMGWVAPPDGTCARLIRTGSGGIGYEGSLDHRR